MKPSDSQRKIESPLNNGATESRTFWWTVGVTAALTFSVIGLSIALVRPEVRFFSAQSQVPDSDRIQGDGYSKKIDSNGDQALFDLSQAAPLVVPDLNELEKNEFGESVLRGKALLENTKALLPKHVGANMSCTNCHLASGTKAFAIPWVGITARFPQYRARTGKMDTLQERVNDCFERSLNGKPLDPISVEMTDIVSYMTWLSRGYRIGQSVEGSGLKRIRLERPPNLARGQALYDAKCAACHKASGEGHFDEGSQRAIFPPLWTQSSFNIGAGMARLHTAAGFIQHNMPQGQEGSLSDDEAYDIAAYFIQQSRPQFKKTKHDWPKGGKPSDARY